MRRQRGFTLLELLVVIAAISVLAALLMPGLDAALKKVDQVDCLNNVRQMLMASHLYMNAFNGYPPIMDYSPDPELEGYTIHFFGSYIRTPEYQDVRHDRGLLTPYLGSSGAIYRCRFAAAFDMLSQCLPGNELACTYGYNTDLGARWVADPPGSWNYVAVYSSMASVTRASEAIAFCDGAANYIWLPGSPNTYGDLRESWTIDWYPADDWGVNQPRRDGTCHFRHDGTANVGFFDGSARSIDPPEPEFLEQNNEVDFPYLATSPYYTGK